MIRNRILEIYVSHGQDSPDTGALLRGLTEKEAQLLQALGECVSGGHYGGGGQLKRHKAGERGDNAWDCPGVSNWGI